MSNLDFNVPSGYTILETIKDGTTTYVVAAPIGASRATTILSVQRISVAGNNTTIEYAECLYADIKIANYIGLEG